MSKFAPMIIISIRVLLRSRCSSPIKSLRLRIYILYVYIYTSGINNNNNNINEKYNRVQSGRTMSIDVGLNRLCPDWMWHVRWNRCRYPPNKKRRVPSEYINKNVKLRTTPGENTIGQSEYHIWVAYLEEIHAVDGEIAWHFRFDRFSDVRFGNR